MPITNINTLKAWFETGDKPTQQQFWNWLDSYYHKNDKIGLGDLTEEVINILNGIGSGVFLIAINAQSITVPEGMYDKIIVEDEPGTLIKIGTTEGGMEILEEEVAINEDGFYSLVLDFKFSCETAIYVTGATATAIIKVRKS